GIRLGRVGFGALLLIGILMCILSAARASEYAFGADLSFLKQVEDKGTKFKDGGVVKPGLQIFRDHGYNWIRLRICVEPVSRGLPNDLAYTIVMAKEAKQLGFKFLLDFHYSNGWSDPRNEPTPDAWKNLAPEALVDAVFAYTRDTVAALRDAGVLPDMVGVGNEIGNGTMWPVGKLPENWDNFAALIYAGVNGVDAGRGNNRRPRIMIHVDHGGDVFLTKTFFDRFNSYGIPYDVIGLSFYPWSHGTLPDLKANLAYIAEDLKKDVIVVETGYYWKPSEYFKKLPPPFPETPEGQRQWLEAVNDIVMSTPNGRGIGIFWWEPAASGGLRPRGYFDGDGNAQPVMSAFDRLTRPAHRVDEQFPPRTPPAALRFGPAP
ncbi:MAG: glycosyl hydrolase 53 family protein, partial [Verrucomicrobiota bacterium]